MTIEKIEQFQKDYTEILERLKVTNNVVTKQDIEVIIKSFEITQGPMQILFLSEIALQLAELNKNIKEFTNKMSDKSIFEHVFGK